MTESQKLDAILKKLINIDERVESLERGKTQEPWQGPDPIPGYNLAEWAPEAFHSPGVIGGIVVDEGLARETPCTRINLGNSELWYSKGVVGALSENEKILYCATGVEDMPITEEMKHRQQVLMEATTICQKEVEGLPTGDRLNPYMKCMATVAQKRGVSI